MESDNEAMSEREPEEEAIREKETESAERDASSEGMIPFIFFSRYEDA